MFPLLQPRLTPRQPLHLRGQQPPSRRLTARVPIGVVGVVAGQRSKGVGQRRALQQVQRHRFYQPNHLPIFKKVLFWLGYKLNF
ncbi:hypothetical protein [Nostoc sp. LPT]|uniref:hypothetical protein n=1 Tax=Nostoc sp. LPT TaxID=2815387 RepID=UPI001DFCC650|nr:hypothetical protein [Nostoc sp. LPT]MBN4003837.1 hypothetical protein [Nostoc sp. LPT]